MLLALVSSGTVWTVARFVGRPLNRAERQFVALAAVVNFIGWVLFPGSQDSVVVSMIAHVVTGIVVGLVLGLLLARWLIPNIEKWSDSTVTSVVVEEVVYEPLNVGSSTKQGICFRCRQDKEVILFSTASAGYGNTLGEAEANRVETRTWCCRDCFDRAVREQSHIHYI